MRSDQSTAPTLFIGMPVYNGEQYVRMALDSLVSQTYTSWKLVISDNASTDNTPTICQSFAAADPRIHYIRHEKNLGAIPNFRFLLEMADRPYFMWAAADDMWKESFVEACITGLESSEEIGLAFTNLEQIDLFGAKIRDYLTFAKYVNSDRSASVASYALDPESFGKANLIYGIYKIKTLKEFMISFIEPGVMHFPAADLAFNLGILCRTSLHVDQRVLFCKRTRATASKEPGESQMPGMPYLNGMLNAKGFRDYAHAASLAAQDTPFANLVAAINQYRSALLDDIEAKSLIDRAPLASVIKRRTNAKILWEWGKVKRFFQKG